MARKTSFGNAAYWSRFPNWLPSIATPRAVQLFCVLSINIAWNDERGNENECFRSRQSLARQLSCGVRTIDAATFELEYLGAVRVKPEFGAVDGRKHRPTDDRQTFNTYVLELSDRPLQDAERTYRRHKGWQQQASKIEARSAKLAQKHQGAQKNHTGGARKIGSSPAQNPAHLEQEPIDRESFERAESFETLAEGCSWGAEFCARIRENSLASLTFTAYEPREVVA